MNNITHKLGFIGAGNMTSAIIGGVIKSGVVDAADIIASDTSVERLSFVAEKYGVSTSGKNTEVARAAKMIFIVVKPNVLNAVISEIKREIKNDPTVIIIAAGAKLSNVREKFGIPMRLVNAMPNTPAMVNCGMTAVCAGENVYENDLVQVIRIFNSIGKTKILPEKLFDAFTAIAGCSPAYAYMFIEAMADAGVKHGLSRADALEISAQALFGAAAMVMETGEHPATLRDAVCSPGGATIAAVCELEREGFRNAIISAVNAAVEKYKDIGGSAPKPPQTFEKV